MNPEAYLKVELGRAGINADDATIKQLVPMFLRWREYIAQAREIEIDEEEAPVHNFHIEALPGEKNGI
jgi:hypothetical protein